MADKSPRERETKLSCRNLWKVYGEDPAKFFPGGSAGVADPVALAKSVRESGHIVAACDVSFDVGVGEIFTIGVLVTVGGVPVTVAVLVGGVPVRVAVGGVPVTVRVAVGGVPVTVALGVAGTGVTHCCGWQSSSLTPSVSSRRRGP